MRMPPTPGSEGGLNVQSPVFDEKMVRSLVLNIER
jgi:hypothetical protein